MDVVPATYGRPPLSLGRAASPLDSLTDALTAGGMPDSVVRLVLDNAPGRIAIKDRDGRLLLVNRRFAELAGQTPWDVIGQTDRNLFAGPGPDQVRANDRLALAAGRLMQFEEVLDLPGGPRTFLSVKVPAENVGFPGKVLFEMEGVDRATAFAAMRLAAHKLPIKTKFVGREDAE